MSFTRRCWKRENVLGVLEGGFLLLLFGPSLYKLRSLDVAFRLLLLLPSRLLLLLSDRNILPPRVKVSHFGPDQKSSNKSPESDLPERW